MEGLFPLRTQKAPKGRLSPNNNNNSNRNKLQKQGAEVTRRPGSLEPKEGQAPPRGAAQADPPEAVVGYSPGKENFVNMRDNKADEGS